MPPWPYIACLALGMSLVLASMNTFDQIMQRFRERHTKAWEACGRPGGYFWQGNGDNASHSTATHHVFWFRWMFSTPKWAEGEDDTVRLFQRFRLLSAIFFVVWLTYILLIFTVPPN